MNNKFEHENPMRGILFGVFISILCFWLPVVLLILWMASCSEEPRKADLLEVEKIQPGYDQAPATILYVPVESQDAVMANCGLEGGTKYCCTKGVGEAQFFVYREDKELVCKAHELDHRVYGPAHVGDIL